MELRHLRYFVAVAHEGHVGRAALRLHISQPSLSQQLRALERELGVQLFVRSTRGMTPTAAGTLLLERALTLLADADAVATALRGVDARPPLRLGVYHHAFASLLPELWTLRECFSGIEFVFLTNHDRKRSILEGSVDAALVCGPLTHPAIKLEPVLATLRAVGVSRRHRLADADVVEAADLVNETFVGADPSVEAELASFYQFDDVFGESPHLSRDTVVDYREVALAIGAGAGLRGTAVTDPEPPGCRLIPVRDAPPDVHGVAYREDRADDDRVGLLSATMHSLARGRADLDGTLAPLWSSAPVDPPDFAAPVRSPR